MTELSRTDVNRLTDVLARLPYADDVRRTPAVRTLDELITWLVEYRCEAGAHAVLAGEAERELRELHDVLETMPRLSDDDPSTAALSYGSTLAARRRGSCRTRLAS